MPYAGPIPPQPLPTTPAGDPVWANWLHYQNVVQQDQLIAAQADVVAKLQAAITAIVATPVRPTSDADLVAAWTGAALSSGAKGFAAVDEARKALAAYRLTFKG